jgi:Fic family protein
MRGVRGDTVLPGEFRRSQNWIGPPGCSLGEATYVPPPPAELMACLDPFERFLHDDSLPPLVHAGLTHAQFEAIHPFLDGNGRVGRLLITLLLCEAGVLSQPLLYLSVYFKRHRDRYYELLDRVRQTGDWEAWLAFFLQGVQETAENAAATARRLTERFAADRQRLATEGRKAGSALRVHEALQERPILSIPETRKRTGLAFPTVSAAMRLLEATGLVREITGFSRNRVYVYSEYLRILNEGVEGE